MSKPVSHIAIFGPAWSSWITAATLAKSVAGTDIRIQVIIDNDVASIQKGAQSLTPDAFGYLKHIDIDEKELLRRTDACFKLTNLYERRGEYFTVGYGDYGVDFYDVEFHHYLLKHEILKSGADYDRFALSTTMAKHGRFLHASADPNSILSTLDYGWQVDTEKFTALARERALAFGCIEILGEVSQISLDQQDHDITQIVIDNNEVVVADLYIDTSEQDKYQQAHGAISVTKNLAYDRVMTTRIEIRENDAIPLYSKLISTQFGYIRETPTKHYIEIELHYIEQNCNDEDALKAIASHCQLPKLQRTNVNVTSISQVQKCAALTPYWQRNLVKLLPNFSQLDTFSYSAIELCQQYATRLGELLPSTTAFCSLSDEFNRVCELEISEISDFNLTHYHLNEIANISLNRQTQPIRYSDSMRQLITLFSATGKVQVNLQNGISNYHWISLLIGFGVIPISYDKRADRISTDEIKAKLQRIDAIIQNTAAQQPVHKAYLQQYCR